MSAPLAIWLCALPLLLVLTGTRFGLRAALTVALIVLVVIAAVYWVARFTGSGASASRQSPIVASGAPRIRRVIKVDERLTSGGPIEVTVGTKVVWLTGPFQTVSFPRRPEGPWGARVPDGFVTLFTRPGRYIGTVTMAYGDSAPDARCLVVDVRP